MGSGFARDGGAAGLADFLRRSERICVFTGAGISTESGIPDYRSQGGLWDRYRPVYLQEFLASEEAREEYWRRKRELYANLEAARPNAAHRAVARLAEGRRLLGVITQNIDGLHQAAGVPEDRVIEIHGTNRSTRCLGCGLREGWQETQARLAAGVRVPRCPTCGGLLKPETVSFGESLDPERLRRATAWARGCDLMLVIGSTLVVEPAASFPRMAREGGAALAIVNLSETPQDAAADFVIRGRAGEVLPELVAGA